MLKEAALVPAERVRHDEVADINMVKAAPPQLEQAAAAFARVHREGRDEAGDSESNDEGEDRTPVSAAAAAAKMPLPPVLR